MTDILFYSLISLEIFITNIIGLHLCLKCKYNLSVIISVYFCFTAVIIYPFYKLLNFSHFTENGLFTLFAVLYLLPILFLYGKDIKALITISVCWIFTISAYIVSAIISKMFKTELKAAVTFISLTAIIGISFYFFMRFLKNFCIPLANKFVKKYRIWFYLTCFCSSVTLLGLNFTYSENTILLEVLSFVLLAILIVSNFLLLYNITIAHSDYDKLKSAFVHDQLTGTKNRIAIIDDAKLLIENSIPFFLVFLDLDNFKAVNDNFGHIIGDKYLCSFTEQFDNMLCNKGSLYRYSGDEFVCLYYCSDIVDFISQIENKDSFKFSDDVPPFGGVSCGFEYVTTFRDFKKALTTADSKMYCSKRAKDNTNIY